MLALGFRHWELVIKEREYRLNSISDQTIVSNQISILIQVVIIRVCLLPVFFHPRHDLFIFSLAELEFMVLKPPLHTIINELITAHRVPLLYECILCERIVIMIQSVHQFLMFFIFVWLFGVCFWPDRFLFFLPEALEKLLPQELLLLKCFKSFSYSPCYTRMRGIKNLPLFTNVRILPRSSMRGTNFFRKRWIFWDAIWRSWSS